MKLLARAALLVLLLGSVTAFAVPAQARASRSYECQHPTTTGQEASDLHHIKASVACKEVRKLAKYLDNPRNPDIIGCKRPAHGGPGTPYVKRHHFDGYKVTLQHTYYFTLTKGKAWFHVGGTDFPYNCF